MTSGLGGRSEACSEGLAISLGFIVGLFSRAEDGCSRRCYSVSLRLYHIVISWSFDSIVKRQY